MTRLPPEHSPGYQVRRCHRRFDRLLSARLAREGLKAGYWYYLRALWLEDGLTQKELSDLTAVAETTSVSMIEGMVREGLVERSRDAVDRRKLRVTLTERGRRLEEELVHIARDINSAATTGVDADDLRICLEVLSKMSENLNTAFQAP